jgi:hypothetical protein
MPIVRAFFACCLISAALFGAEQWKTVSNPREHFRISFPANWTIWTPDSNGGIGATSYPKDRALEGGLVPSGEARINVRPLKGQSWTLDQWANWMLSGEEEVQRKLVNLKVTHLSAPTSYLQSESRFEAGPNVYYTEITDFYFLDPRPFAAHLEFIERDQRGPTYRSILDQVVRSVTSTEPLRKK